jgi:hypothetical protein
MSEIAFNKSVVEHLAKAAAFAKYPEVNIGNKVCKTRWPVSPKDTLPGRDDTIPLAWEFAEEKRREARIMLQAFAEIIDPDVAEIIKHLRQIGSGQSHDPIPSEHRADMHDVADKLTEISVLLTALKN